MLTKQQEIQLTTAADFIIKSIVDKGFSYIECEMILFMCMELIKSAKYQQGKESYPNPFEHYG